MKRRTVLQFAGALLAWPAWVPAQTPKQHRLGLLATSDEKTTRVFFLETFLHGMRDLGYVVGRDLVIDVRYAEGDVTRLPGLADELIALKPVLLLGIETAARVLQAKTTTIPIVLLASADPVAAGLVKSLARPGGNVTGMANLFGELIAKQIELLTEIVPKMSRVAYLADSSPMPRDPFAQHVRAAAQAKGLTLIIVSARDPEGIRRAFAELRKERAEGLVVAYTGPLILLRQVIAGEALSLRLPAVYGHSQIADVGGLASYGANLAEDYRKEVPAFVDRILKGAKPEDMPVRQSSKYELVVNLKTAREIGLKIPPSILLRADRVIE